MIQSHDKYVEDVMDILKENIEEPRVELEYRGNAYVLLVAVLLSAQATDISVNKALPILFQENEGQIWSNGTPEYVVGLGIEGVKSKIKTIGLYNNKAKNVYHLSKLLIERHGSQIPRSRKDLEELPGIGRKSANIILNEVYGEATIPVDTHVFRVTNRIGLVKASNVAKSEMELLKVIPEHHLKEAHYLFVLHGRYTCKARKPLCAECCLNKICHKVGLESSPTDLT